MVVTECEVGGGESWRGVPFPDLVQTRADPFDFF